MRDERIALVNPETGGEQRVPDSLAVLLRARGWVDAPAPDAVPNVAALTVDEILTEVGEDPLLASAALTREQAADKPRKTLITALEQIAHPSPSPSNEE